MDNNYWDCLSYLFFVLPLFIVLYALFYFFNYDASMQFLRNTSLHISQSHICNIIFSIILHLKSFRFFFLFWIMQYNTLKVVSNYKTLPFAIFIWKEKLIYFFLIYFYLIREIAKFLHRCYKLVVYLTKFSLFHGMFSLFIILFYIIKTECLVNFLKMCKITPLSHTYRQWFFF